MPQIFKPQERRGAVAVEAAVVLPVLIILMLGVWEVGRMIQVQQILINAALKACRLGAGGYVNSTAVTAAMVQQAAHDYMTRMALPAAAVGGAQITLTCDTTPTWTDTSGRAAARQVPCHGRHTTRRSVQQLALDAF